MNARLIRNASLAAVCSATVTLLGLAAGRGVPAQTQQQRVQPDPHFDGLVREDMFSGMSGDQAAFDRAMKLCEDELAKNPKHAEALAWHGSGDYFLAGRLFQRGEIAKGIALSTHALQEMDEAVALLPESITVLIPRGATLLEFSKHVPIPQQAQALLEKGLADYEKVYSIQKKDLATAPLHSRGELLSALAEGWYREGNNPKARGYLQLIVDQTKDSAYATRARKVLEAAEPPKQLSWHYIGCHAGS